MTLVDELAMPLWQVTFVVLDLETTGGSPRGGDAITEVGALKLRGGELLGRFETLVNPGVPIPPMITVLTGITEAMLMPAPRVEAVLPALLEFVGDSVIVGHNIRFDCAFLDAALLAHGYGKLANRRVDTLALARRLVRDEVDNLRLHTLATHLRSSVEPAHRAYADAAATADVLHSLLERAGTFGVVALDDLLALPSVRAHRSAAKLALTARLPRAPGIYVFRDRAGRALYVGSATHVRNGVRSLFSTPRRTRRATAGAWPRGLSPTDAVVLDLPQLLTETTRIEHRECAGPLEASVRALRLVRELQPRFNRRSQAWRRYSYVKVTAERHPKFMVTRTLRADGGCYIGPLPSGGAARVARDAIAHVASLTGDDPGAIADRVRRAAAGEPAACLAPLGEHLAELVDAERYEEAATVRDRIATLARALAPDPLVDALRHTERVVFATDEGTIELRFGHVVLADHPSTDTRCAPDGSLPPARDEIDELLLVARWLRHARRRSVLEHATAGFASPVTGRYARARLRAGS